MAKDLEFHEAADLFPLLEGKEYETFKADIEKHGLITAGVLCEGKILDGRNRYRVCKELGHPFPADEWNGECGDPWSYVASVNLHRRQLSTVQKARIAVKLREHYAEEMERLKLEGQKKGGGDRKSEEARAKIACASKDAQAISIPTRTGPRSRASHKAGKDMNVSGATVDRMRIVEGKGSKRLNAALDAGEIGLRPAATLAANFAKVRQDEILEGGPEAVKAVIAEIKDEKAHPDDDRGPKGFNKTEQYALRCAEIAVTQLGQIPVRNPGRDKAFTHVEQWIAKQRSKS